MFMLLKEDLGIARPTIPYVNLVYNLTEDMVIEFFNEHTKPTSHTIEFGPKEISKLFNKEKDRKSTRLNSSHVSESRMPSSA